jgi:PilZ domain
MELRRQHRIVYQTKIFLKTAERLEDVVARVQNLSPLGVFVTTSAADLPEAGTEVFCRFTLARQARTVRGRVVWVRTVSKKAPLRSPGAGIEFLGLEKRDLELLRQLVDPVDGERQPVDVLFEGMDAPIRCQAAVVGEEVRLATRLPFMRLHSAVRITFVQQPGGVVREGNLDSVMLEPSDEQGIPHLRLSISTAVLDNARGTIEVKPSLVAASMPHVRMAPAAQQASTVVDPKLVTAPPPGWLTFGTQRHLHRGDTKNGPTRLDASVLQAFSPPTWKARARGAMRSGMIWLGGGWRPLVLGGVAGALAVSVLWSLF